MSQFTPVSADSDVFRTAPTRPEQGTLWPLGPLSQAEIVSGHRRYLRALGHRGHLPESTNEGDVLIDDINREGD